MRTGATNIADYMAGRRGLHIDRITLSVGLGALLAGLAWRASRGKAASGPKTVPDTNDRYWMAMLVAGVFGTVHGDLCEHLVGEGIAALGLGAVLILALLLYAQGLLAATAAYWLTIATARTTGTAIGDWLAENSFLHIGLPPCTLLTGLAFAAVLVLWRPRRPVDVVGAT